jgi:hypothetical protein
MRTKRTDRTDMKKLIVTFRSFVNASKSAQNVPLSGGFKFGNEKNEIKFVLYSRVWQYKLEGVNV